MKKTACVLISMIILAAMNSSFTGQGHAQSQSITPLKLGNGSINEVAWSPDGQHLAIGSSYGTWIYDNDLNNPEQIWHETTEALEWSRDNKALQLSVLRYIDSSPQREVLLVDIETKTSRNVEGKSRAGWSHDRFNRLWNGDDPTMISDWNLQSKCRRKTYRHPTDDTLLCVTRNDIVQLWDSDAQLLNELHMYMGDVGGTLWGRNEYQLVVHDRDKTRTQVWDVRTGELIMGADEFLDDEVPLAWYQSKPDFEIFTQSSSYVAWTADGSRFAIMTESDTIRVLDTGDVLLEVNGIFPSWSRSGQFLAMINTEDGLYIWDVESQEVVWHQERTGFTAWHPVNDIIALTSEDGVAVLDIMSGTAQNFTLPENVSTGRYSHNIVWLSNGNSILLDMTINGFGKQAIWDIQSGEIVNVIEEDLTLVAAYDDQLATVLYCCRETHGNTSTEIVVRDAFGDAITHQIDLAEFTGQLSSVQDLQWNSNGEYLAAIVDHDEIYVFGWGELDDSE